MKYTIEEYIEFYKTCCKDLFYLSVHNPNKLGVVHTNLQEFFSEVDWSAWTMRQLELSGWQTRTIIPDEADNRETWWIGAPVWAIPTLKPGFVYHDSNGNQICHQKHARYDTVGNVMDIGFIVEELPMQRPIAQPVVVIKYRHHWQSQNILRVGNLLNTMGLSAKVRLDTTLTYYYQVEFPNESAVDKDIRDSIINVTKGMSYLAKQLR